MPIPEGASVSFYGIGWNAAGTDVIFGGGTDMAPVGVPDLGVPQIVSVPASIVLDEPTSQWFTYTVRLSDVPTPPPGSPHIGVVVTIIEQSPQIEMVWLQVNDGSGFHNGNTLVLKANNWQTGAQVRIRARRNAVDTTGHIGRMVHRITGSEAPNYTLTITDANGQRVSGSAWTGGNNPSAPAESRNVVQFTVIDDD